MTGVQPLAALLGRILIAAVFLWSGYGKVTDFAGNVGYATSVGMPLPQIGVAIGAVIELLGSTLLILGFQTRLVALIMTGFAIATALIFHRDFSQFEQAINFMKNLSIAGGLLQIVAFGGGRYSIDARRR
ncbi:MAG TPA: DoxX family protein [Dongiaceae bacterium]|nr:DoxX family protein [Dongiaceae bacterium]